MFWTDVPHAGEMQDGIEEHGRVSVGQDETVAIEPRRILRIIAKNALPNRVNKRR
jgi:hypothetical protein